MRGTMRNESASAGRHQARAGTTGWCRLILPLGVAIVFAVSCTSSSTPSDTTSSAPRSTTSTIPLVASKDLVTGVQVDPAPHSTHVPIVTVETKTPTVVTVTATSGEHEVVTPASEPATTHAVPILGLWTDRDYELSVTAESDDEAVFQTVAAPGYTTPPLPKGFPELEVTTSEAKQASPGVTFIPLIAGDSEAVTDPLPGAPEGPPSSGRVIGVDETGAVVWYYESELQVISVEPTSSGTLLLGLDEGTLGNLDSSVREIDLLGNTLAEWGSKTAMSRGTSLPDEPLGPKPIIPVDVDSMHHDIHELPNGNLIALSTELIATDPETARTLCPANPATHLVADVVVEFERSGAVVGRWPVAPLFDPVARPGSDMCPDGPDPRSPEGWMYPDVTGERDWTHANAVDLDEEHNALIVSLREVDSVVAIRYQDDENGPAGEALWDLGPEGDLTMRGDGLFQYHQHGIDFRGKGTVLAFDNGNLRPGTQDSGGIQPSFSRAVLYKIDPKARTVRQVWEHRDESPWGGPMYVPFLSDTDPLENGNVLITYGAFLDRDNRPHARIVEVAPDIEGGGAGDEVVFDMTIGGQTGAGWVAYHSVKLPSLYPAP